MRTIAGFAFGLFTISMMLFLGTFYSVIHIKRPRGVYPPKVILKRRALAMAGGGAVFMLLGIFVSSIH